MLTAATFITLFQALGGLVNVLPGLVADYNAIKSSFSTTDQASADAALAAAQAQAQTDIAKTVADLTAAGQV